MQGMKVEIGGFTIDEFLTPQQVTSFFSRMATKLKNKHEEIIEDDTTAAEDQAAYSSTRTNILENCQLMHPIVYVSFNLCTLNASNGFKRLSENMLRMMCEYFDFSEILQISQDRGKHHTCSCFAILCKHAAAFHQDINCMSLRLIPLSNVKTKEQQQIFKTYGFTIKRVTKGGGGGGGGSSNRASRLS